MMKRNQTQEGAIRRNKVCLLLRQLELPAEHLKRARPIRQARSFEFRRLHATGASAPPSPTAPSEVPGKKRRHRAL